MKQISILGCGWLGLPLAKSLLEKGFLVKGSTTSTEKLPLLKECGIEPHIVSLSAGELPDETKISIHHFLSNSEILIIDIPPKLRGASTENFVGKIQNLIPLMETSSVKNVVFVSSTSVYNDNVAIDNITEETQPHPDTESGKQLLETEQLLLRNSNFKSIILRFGGLIGEDRHPITFLTGRKNIENPNAPINLIHQIDCIGIIETIIEKGLRQAQSDKSNFNEIFNAVAPFHPTRKEYYTQKAQELHLPLPEFDESKPSIEKLISSNKVETILNYKFKNNLL
jgi:nucleoside-diphosphate-sugar epimerase